MMPPHLEVEGKTTLGEVELGVDKHHTNRTNQDRLTGRNLEGNEEPRRGHRNDFRKGLTTRFSSLLFLSVLFFNSHIFTLYSKLRRPLMASVDWPLLIDLWFVKAC